MESVIIYGTKLEAEKVLYLCKKIYIKCKYLIDDCEQKSLHGIPILNINNISHLKFFCIVACSSFETYKIIKKRLVKKGYIEFTDFIWSRLWNKEIVLINANCHGTALKKYLESSAEFNRKYAIYPIPEIQMNDEKEIENNILKHINIYIHQDIRRENTISYKLSDEYILQQLSESAKKICIPNFVGLGNIYQQYCGKIGYVTRGENPQLLFYKDELIDESYNYLRNNNIDLTINNILKYQRKKKYNYEVKFEKILNKIKIRENNWDIKVSEFISNHKYCKRLFNDISHPGNELMKYICDEVMKILKLPIVSFGQFGLGAEAVVCPFVSRYIEENYQARNDNKEILLYGEQIDNYEEYIRQYIWIMYDEYLE